MKNYTHHLFIFGFVAILVGLVSMQSCTNYNPVNDTNFNSDGHAIYLDEDSTEVFKNSIPQKVKFYVEVSGSMNGLFRSNVPTDFKRDVWRVLNYFETRAPKVTILTNDGNQGASFSQSNFRQLMNTGGFQSQASTKVPLMLESIIRDLNTDAGEVAILISDMKYSPVGSAAPNVLLEQYSTDISKILGRADKAVSLVCAKSSFYDSQGNMVTDNSPYYYFIIGNSEEVSYMRNAVSTLLENENSFVDNIETGFKHGGVRYTFGVSNKCIQLNEEPTFTNFEDIEDADTCTIKLKVDISKYRWIMGIPEAFRNSLQVKTLYGSEVKVGNIDMKIDNMTNKQLNRTAVAIVDIKLFNMPLDADVIEWNLVLPDNDINLFNDYFENAVDENDPTKSYSLLNFVKGMFYCGTLNTESKKEYILVTKENQ